MVELSSFLFVKSSRLSKSNSSKSCNERTGRLLTSLFQAVSFLEFLVMDKCYLGIRGCHCSSIKVTYHCGITPVKYSVILQQNVSKLVCCCSIFILRKYLYRKIEFKPYIQICFMSVKIYSMLKTVKIQRYYKLFTKSLPDFIFLGYKRYCHIIRLLYTLKQLLFTLFLTQVQNLLSVIDI